MSTPSKKKEEMTPNLDSEMKATLVYETHITQHELLNLHQKKLENKPNYNNEANTQRIVDIFGGIDSVLTILLSSEQIKLNRDELIEINNLITETNNDTGIIREIYGNEIPVKWTYFFSKKNTFLHSIFGDRIGQKLFNFLYSKYAFILTIILFILQIFVVFDISVYVRISVMILCVLCAVYMILSANIRCFRLIVKSFHFWFKLLYATQLTVAHLMYYISNFHDSKIYIVAGGIEIIGVNALFTMFALVDAFQIRVVIKLIIGSLFAFGTTLFAVVWGLELFLNPDDSVIYIEFIGWSISMKSIRLNAVQILSIFMWKQVISSVLKKQRCVLLKYSPYLKWVDPQIENHDEQRNDNTNLMDIKQEYNQSITMIETNITKKNKSID